jgi:hypothetical protein
VRVGSRGAADSRETGEPLRTEDSTTTVRARSRPPAYTCPVTDLELVHADRDRAADIMARRIEPTFGFVAYGVLWLFIGSIPATALAIAAALGAVALFGKGSTAVDVISTIAGLAGLVLAWWPFARWARRKRERARRVVRDGVLCEARVATGTADELASLAVQTAVGGGVHWERVDFDHAGIAYTGVAPFATSAPPGTVAHVLFAPAATYAIAFSPTGHAYPMRPRIRRR